MAQEILTEKEVASILGEGVHTGLRKGSEASDAHILWEAIADSNTTAWSDAVAFCAWGLSEMGLKVVRDAS